MKVILEALKRAFPYVRLVGIGITAAWAALLVVQVAFFLPLVTEGLQEFAVSRVAVSENPVERFAMRTWGLILGAGVMWLAWYVVGGLFRRVYRDPEEEGVAANK